jgi:hypothetical protein
MGAVNRGPSHGHRPNLPRHPFGWRGFCLCRKARLVYFAAPLLRAACSAEFPAGAAGVTPVFVEFSELLRTPGAFVEAAPELRAACSALFVAGAPIPLLVWVELLEPVEPDVPAVPEPDDAPEDALPPLAPPPLPLPPDPPPPPPPPPWARDGLAPARSAATIIAYFETISFLPKSDRGTKRGVQVMFRSETAAQCDATPETSPTRSCGDLPCTGLN